MRTRLLRGCISCTAFLLASVGLGAAAPAANKGKAHAPGGGFVIDGVAERPELSDVPLPVTTTLRDEAFGEFLPMGPELLDLLDSPEMLAGLTPEGIAVPIDSATASPGLQQPATGLGPRP